MIKKNENYLEMVDIHSTRQVTKNVVYIIGSMGIAAISSFALMVIIGRFLGVAVYGVFATAWTILTLITGFCTGGFSYALSKYVPENAIREDKAGIKVVLITGYRLVLFCSLLFGGCLLIGADLISRIFYHGEMTNTLKIVAGCLPISCLFSILLSSFIGLQKIKFHLFINTIQSLLKLAIVPAFMVIAGAAGGLLSIVFGFSVSIIVGLLIIRQLTTIKTEDIFKLRNPLITRKIVFYALPIVISSVSGILLRQGGILLLSYQSTVAAAGLFTACFVLVSPLQLITGAIGSAIVPTFSELWVTNKRREAENLQALLIKYLSLLMLPVVVLFLSIPDIILKGFFGLEYLAASQVLGLLACGSFILLISSVFISFLLGIGRSITILYIAGIGAVLMMGLGLLLIPWLGIEGAAIAFLLSCISQTVASIIYIRQLGYLDILPKKFMGPLLAALFMFIIIIVLRLVIFANFGVVIGVIFGSISYVISLLLLRSISKDDLSLMRRLIRFEEKILIG